MFNGLDNFVQQSLQRDMQNKIVQAQLQAKKAEKNLVSKKYDSGYPGVFGTMTNALNDASIAYGNKFNETIRSKQGFTQELLTRVWDDGMHVDHTRYLNDIRSYRDMINIHKMKVTACNTLAEADLEFSKTEDQYNKFFSEWKIKTSESAQRWTSHFDKLVIEANNPVANVAQNVPNQNPVLQGGNDLLQQLNAIKAENDIIKAQLAQKDIALDMYKSSLDQAKLTIDDQKITITDLREDKIELKEKVNEQKIKIDTLTEANLEQVEKIHQVSDKYLGLKTNFIDLVTLHQEIDPDYVPVVDLAGLDLNQL